MPVRRRLSLAISHYDHVSDLLSGVVEAEGIDLTALELPVEEIFYRFVNHREFDVSEMSFAKYVALRSAQACDITAIPVFPSRMFRQSALYVLRDSGLVDPADLRGCKVGIPEWAQTAQVYVRGWLSEDLGLPLDEIEWFQAGVNEAGRKEKVGLRLPSGVSLTPVPDKSLSQMLIDGEVDAISTAHPPAAFEAGDGTMRRLLPDTRAAELAYFERTRIFPIMHVIAIRREIYEADRWIAQSLFKAFEAARERSVSRAAELTASRFPIPWAADHATEMKSVFGGDPFVYGVEQNRVTLEAFLRFCEAQGVAARALALEELFAPESLSRFRI